MAFQANLSRAQLDAAQGTLRADLAAYQALLCAEGYVGHLCAGKCTCLSNQRAERTKTAVCM